MSHPHGWLEAQLAERKTEPNSGLDKAITYLVRHARELAAKPAEWMPWNYGKTLARVGVQWSAA